VISHRQLAVLFACLLPGCNSALLSKSAPLDVRYFSPPPTSGAAERALPPDTTRPELRLGRISAAPHIGRRIVFRSDAHEVGYYEKLRWTESPDEYVRWDLVQTLFEREGLVRVVSGAAPTLDVELVAFEEVMEPKHVARVILTATLVDGRHERYGRTFVIERPISAKDDPASTVEALSSALHEGVERVAGDVVGQLGVAVAHTPKGEPTHQTQAER
jgi:cholesterol transport system auxiliary component